MKAKSRRRLLISSLAMLLVAMLALGTATFAWFTTTADANANQINVKTTKSSFLQVAKLDLDFKDTVTYVGAGDDAAMKLKPASSANGTNWFYGEAIAHTGFATNEFKTVDSSAIGHSGDGLYVYREMLNIKNGGTGKVKTVKIKMSASNMDSTARIAIVPVATQTKAEGASGFSYPDVSSSFASNIYATTASKTWDAANATGAPTGHTTAMTSVNKAADNAEITVGDMNAGDVKSYAILVWFEGQDTDLFDDSTNAFTVPNISFNVTGSTAAD